MIEALVAIAILVASSAVIDFFKDLFVEVVEKVASSLFGSKWGRRISNVANRVFTVWAKVSNLIDLVGGINAAVNEYNMSRDFASALRQGTYSLLGGTEITWNDGRKYQHWSAKTDTAVPELTREIREKRVVKYAENY
jgi:hypothetical protein